MSLAGKLQRILCPSCMGIQGTGCKRCGGGGYVWETWAVIPGTSGFYEASTSGFIRSFALSGPGNTGRRRSVPVVLEPYEMPSGYLQVGLGMKRKDFVHRLVLETFIGPAPVDCVASHLNGLKRDNRVENLCWESQLQNNRRQFDHGTKPVGVSVCGAKLNDARVRELRKRGDAGESATGLARLFGISKTTALRVIQRLAWRHVVDESELEPVRPKAVTP